MKPFLHATAQRQLDDFCGRHAALSGLRENIERAVQMICETHARGGQLLLCGNGGSAADCDHIAGELMKGFALPRPIPADDARRLSEYSEDGVALAKRLQRGVRAISLASHNALGTAIANDVGADMIFAQQVYVLGKTNDLLLAISTSGHSPNVLNALRVARSFGLKTIGLGGKNTAPMDALCDVLLKVPAVPTFAVQEYHLPVYHAICLAVEQQLFGDCEA